MNREDSYALLYQAFRSHLDSFLDENEPINVEKFTNDIQEILGNFIRETNWDDIATKENKNLIK